MYILNQTRKNRKNFYKNQTVTMQKMKILKNIELGSIFCTRTHTCSIHSCFWHLARYLFFIVQFLKNPKVEDEH